jgi:sporulation integral membrane protein YlbJ
MPIHNKSFRRGIDSSGGDAELKHAANRFRRFLYALAPLSLAAALILAPETTSAAAAEGLRLCGCVLIPSLFPFFVCVNLFSEFGLCEKLGQFLEPVMRPLFHVGGAGAAALALGLAGGYPAGAQAVETLYESGRVTKAEAEQLLKFCSNSGPAFIFGVLGGAVFQNEKAGLFLYLLHAAGAVLTGVVLRPPQLPAKSPPVPEKTDRGAGFSAAFTSSVRRAGSAILQVCMFVTIFSVVSRTLLAAFGPRLPQNALPLLIGSLELTAGAEALKSCAMPISLNLTCASFLLGFGGLSVYAQSQSILAGSGLKASLRAKLLQGLLSAALTLPAALLLFPEPAPSGAFQTKNAILLPICFFCLAFAFLTGGNRRGKRV